MVFPVSIRALFALVCSSSALAASYAVDVLPIPVPYGGLFDINNTSQIAGFGINGTGAYQAFVGNLAGHQAIPVPTGWSNAYGYAINSSGQVAGYGVNATGIVQAFIGSPAGSQAIPIPAGWNSAYGYGINDSGQVAGFVGYLGGAAQAFIGTTSGSTVIPIPSGWRPSSSYGYAINSLGQVVGYGNNGRDWQAFIGSTTGSTAIPLPIGWSSAFGYAINDLGQVAGYGINGAGSYQAFIGTPSGSTAIPLTATSATVPIYQYGGFFNNSGVVVGVNVEGPFIWDASNGTRNLNSLLPQGWVVNFVMSINQSGRILAQGSYGGRTALWVELVPTSSLPATPAPGTGFLAGLGLLLVFAWRIRLGLAANPDKSTLS